MKLRMSLLIVVAALCCVELANPTRAQGPLYKVIGLGTSGAPQSYLNFTPAPATTMPTVNLNNAAVNSDPTFGLPLIDPTILAPLNNKKKGGGGGGTGGGECTPQGMECPPQFPPCCPGLTCIPGSTRAFCERI